jgi:hypothetical protein
VGARARHDERQQLELGYVGLVVDEVTSHSAAG